VIRAGTTNAYAEVEFGRLKEHPPFDAEGLRAEFLARLRRIPNVAINNDQITKYPGVRFSVLAQADSLARFLDSLDWVVAEIRKT
jgi:hypothetical protein